jgi:hypothetical protein
MEDDIDLVSLIPLRDLTKALVDACMDASLLDLIAKLLTTA